MSFSHNWERSYQQNRQQSRWPWTDLVSLVYRHWDGGAPWRVLELGCGAGANLSFFEVLGFAYHGVDGSPTAIERLEQAHPELAPKLATADFTQTIPFDGPFDLIFDRAALTHNDARGVRSCLELAWPLLRPGGLFIGVHWFSDRSAYATQGEPIGDDGLTRGGYRSGPFVDIDPVHFFSRGELEQLFAGGELLTLEHQQRIDELSSDHAGHAMWNFSVRKPATES